MAAGEKRMPVANRITIKDVAREAGVSVTAVSHALNPNPGSTIRVSEATVMRVQEAVRRTGFRPHAGARSMRSNRFNNIGFLVVRKGVDSRPPEDYLMGVNDAAHRKGYRVVLVGLEQGEDDYRKSISSLLREKSLDALVVASYHQLSSVIHEALADLDLPVVYVNDRYKHNSVWVDDRLGGRIMTDYLLERGYRDIVFALRQHFPGQRVEQMHCSAVERLEGYRQSMADAGLKPDVRMIEIPEPLRPQSRLFDHDLLENIYASIWLIKYRQTIRIRLIVQ